MISDRDQLLLGEAFAHPRITVAKFQSPSAARQSTPFDALVAEKNKYAIEGSKPAEQGLPSAPLRAWNLLPVGVGGPQAPDRHRPQVVASAECVHRGNRLRSAELQATGIHLMHHR